MYDPSLGRWHASDPMEQYVSPYVYAGNNPVLFIDPTGMYAEAITKTVINPEGEIIYHDDDPNDKNIYFSPDGEQGKDGNTDGLDKVGVERTGRSYEVGSQVTVGDFTAEGMKTFLQHDYPAWVTVNYLTEEWESLFFATDVVLIIGSGAAYSGTGMQLRRIKLNQATTSSGVKSIQSNPKGIWGKSVKQIANAFRRAGFKVKVVQSTRGSGKSVQIRIEGSNINNVQVHPGGGRHGGAYYKISTSDRVVIKIVDRNTYKSTPGEKATIIYAN